MPLISEPVPYEEAARIVAEKQIMSKEAFDALCDELKVRAFVVTGLEDLRAVQEIRDAIAELPRGAAWEGSDERREKGRPRSVPAGGAHGDAPARRGRRGGGRTAGRARWNARGGTGGLERDARSGWGRTPCCGGLPNGEKARQNGEGNVRRREHPEAVGRGQGERYAHRNGSLAPVGGGGAVAGRRTGDARERGHFEGDGRGGMG